MTQILGMALWALIPGFIAKKKGRNFWGYYFLSFLISPLITTIIALCISNISEKNEKETASSDIDNIEIIRFCRKCGEQLIDNSNFCRKCGTEILIKEEKHKPNKKCELCDKETDHLSYCEIKDEYGTRYRNICDECVLKHGAKEQKI